MSEITDVVVEKVGSRIHLHSAPPWEVPGLLAKIKRVPGANWRKTDSVWTYPLSMDVCRSLRRQFDDLLVIGPELEAWSHEAAKAEAARVRLAHLKTARLSVLPLTYPDIYSAMRKYQRVGAKYLAQAPSILADQPGLGKTLQLLASIVEGDRLQGTHLIAAPVTSLEVVWVRQVLKWLGHEATHVVGSAKKRQAIIDQFFEDVSAYPPESGYAHWLIVNPEMLSIKQNKDHSGKVVSEDIKYPDLHAHNWTTFTVDEAQDYLLGIKNTTRMTQTGLGLTRVNSEHRTALTGTPFRGRVKNVWGILHWLYPDVYKSYWQWVETYFVVTDNGFGKEISDDPSPDMAEEFYRMLDTVMLRRTKTEVLKELPPKEYNDIWVDMSPAQAKQYNDMITHSEAKFGDVHMAATGILAELTRCTQIATACMSGEWVEVTGKDPITGKPKTRKVFQAEPTADSGKFARLLEELHKRGVVGKPEDRWGTNKYVVASQSTQVLKFLEAWLNNDHGVETLRIDGGVSQKERTARANAFQEDGGARIMLLQTETAKAIDLDAWCDEMFIIDETFVPDDQEQLEDRIHRASRIHQVTIHYLRTRGTIDEYRKELVDTKESIQKLILDGRRGVEFARKLMGR